MKYYRINRRDIIMTESINMKAHTLFDIIIELSAQYKIKDRTTPITLELLEHDNNLEDNIKAHINELGVLIKEADRTNAVIHPEFRKLYQMHIELHDSLK